MKNITQHTGKLRLIERLPNSRNGNPRYLCAIMDQQLDLRKFQFRREPWRDPSNNDLGWTFRTQVDAMHGYEVQNYFDRDIDVTVTIGTHYGHPTLNTIWERNNLQRTYGDRIAIHRAKLASLFQRGVADG